MNEACSKESTMSVQIVLYNHHCSLIQNIPAEFLSFYGLLNFYLYTLAFVYSPSKNALYGELDRSFFVAHLYQHAFFFKFKFYVEFPRLPVEG